MRRQKYKIYGIISSGKRFCFAIICLMSQIGSSASFFLFGRAGAATGMWLPPRRRAFRSNDFGTIPPPTIGDGGISDRQRHSFSPKSFPLQSLTHARRTPLPFRGEQRTTSSHGSPAPRFSHAPSPFQGLQRFPSSHLLRFVWCYKKEGLFEAGSITLSLPPSDVFRRNTRLCNPTRPCGVERRHRKPLAARESASKLHETCSPRKGDVGKMWSLSQPGAIMYITT